MKKRYVWNDFADRAVGCSRGWAGFKAKPRERIALGYMGDLFVPARETKDIAHHLDRALFQYEMYGCTFLIQTRHVERALALDKYDQSPAFEWGASFTGGADIENVRALRELPPDTVRFIAFEPFVHPQDGSGAIGRAIINATPNWCYIGLQTGPGATRHNEHDIEMVERWADWMKSATGCKVIFKPNCGPRLYARNEGVTLP
jgi:protein gp37